MNVVGTRFPARIEEQPTLDTAIGRTVIRGKGKSNNILVRVKRFVTIT